ncbi:MAG TPA: molybdopterin cofactor-binding domain-containing protein [Steroidobacteraceae bacterium]|nr:molybdopterin cofactor-binding domain-containing protein [Steroidobacteraceae bacterium]
MNRRHFIWTAATVTGALAVGVALGPGAKLAARLKPVPPLGQGGWIEIDSSGAVHLFSTITEMGQGAWTCLAQIVCEELAADYSRITVEMAPAWRAYDKPVGFGTGGSDSTIRIFNGMRDVAARARMMLIQAAARHWHVPAEQCFAHLGKVIHGSTNRTLNFGDLANDAAKESAPDVVALKPREQWELIGRSIPRLDNGDKITGRAEYGIDFRLPGMLIAAIAQAPTASAQREHFDADAASAIRGVQVVDLDDLVAIVAKDYWTAQKGLLAAAPRWRPARIDSRSLREQLLRAVEASDQPTRATVSATYDCPALLHAQLEPLNATARVDRFGAELWVPTQAQGAMKSDIAEALGLWTHAVTVHTGLVGGGFGRRLATDYGVAAARIAKQFDVPIKCIWSREADSMHARPRPMSAARLVAEMEGGKLKSLHARVASLGKKPRLGSLDAMPYQGFALGIEYAGVESDIIPGSWRSVDSSQNVFFRECFIDECAAAAQTDPIEFRRTLLAHDARALRVLARAAVNSEWGSAKAAGRYLGVAYSGGFGSHCAQVAELVRTSTGKFRVAKVFAVVDCGTAINPDIVRSQIEGGILFGLSAALFEQLTWSDGVLQQTNYDQYRVLRINEAPQIFTEIIESPEANIGGIGEVGVPPTAPAVTNALFAAHGLRVRRLPLSAEDVPLDYT